ncbi:MAG: metallopeptidase [DPANN group archaeon]|nr:metallopeptidase [DPANN group archaeon]
MIKYEPAFEIRDLVGQIANSLGMAHIDLSRLACFRSTGSASRAIARCYALSKIWQQALNTKAHYIIEVISEKFDRLSDSDKEKVLIHELMHIPKAFGGGFRQHDFVCARNVEALYKQLKMHTFSAAPQNSILR